MDRKANRKARIGVYTTGLKAYWPQFKGLKERLEGYGRFIAEKIAAFGDALNDLAMINDPEFEGYCVENGMEEVKAVSKVIKSPLELLRSAL